MKQQCLFDAAQMKIIALAVKRANLSLVQRRAVQLQLKLMQSEPMKHCPVCGCDMLPVFFYDDVHYKDGKYWSCKFCKNNANKKSQRERRAA